MNRLAYLGGRFELHKGALHLPVTSPSSVEPCLTRSAYGVVSAGEEALGLEFEVGVEVLRIVAHGTCIAEFEHHLSKEDAACVHVRHRHHVF